MENNGTLFNKIRLLVVNDIHEGFSSIDDLRKNVEKMKIPLEPKTKNMIVVAGDLTNVKLKDYDTNTTNPALEKALKSTQQIIEQLLEIEPFSEIVVLPGNHDHPFFFSGKSFEDVFPTLKNPKKKRVRNLEKEELITIETSEDAKLSVFGLGGAVPAFLIPKYSKFGDPNIWKHFVDAEEKLKMKVWDGGPPAYSKLDHEAEFEKVLAAKLKRNFSSQKNQKNDKNILHQIIFCSHMGPFTSSTSIVKDKVEEKNPDPANNVIYSGSTALDELFDTGFNINGYLKKSKNEESFEAPQVILAIHGHTHAAPGSEKRKWEINNFGALYKGKFGFIELEKINKIWSMSKIEFCNMETHHEYV